MNNSTKLKQLRESNTDRNGALVAQGVSIHPLSIVQAQLNALIDAFGQEAQLKLEENIAELLDQAESELARVKLTQGLSLPNFNKEGK